MFLCKKIKHLFKLLFNKSNNNAFSVGQIPDGFVRLTVVLYKLTNQDKD